jgi:predicted DNA-binding transcriptional regulator AlpA
MSHQAALDFGLAETHRIRSRADAAQFLNLSVSTLERWDRLGIGPKVIKIGPRRVGYRVCDLNEFAEAHQEQKAA